MNRLTCGVFLLSFLIASASLRANETDQFTLPPDKEFVDLGHYFSAVHYRVIKNAVDSTNKKIARALKSQDPAIRKETLGHLHSPAALADAIRGQYKPGFFDMMDIEGVLHSKQNQANFPGKLLAYKTHKWIYADVHLPIDPRKAVLLFQSSTIKLYGSYMGVDKISHFHDLGHIYFKQYLSAIANGLSPEEAQKSTLNDFVNGPISERGVIGTFATGVYSNADLAANFVGFKFYRNLTEPERLKGVMRPPLVVRDGEFWKLNTHVTETSDFFRWFVSDHFNEALNPCIYEAGMRGPITRQLERNAATILAVYADPVTKQPRTREWFDKKADETLYYYGEDYGHSGQGTTNVTISKCCFGPEAASSNTASNEKPKPVARPRPVAPESVSIAK